MLRSQDMEVDRFHLSCPLVWVYYAALSFLVWMWVH